MAAVDPTAIAIELALAENKRLQEENARLRAEVDASDRTIARLARLVHGGAMDLADAPRATPIPPPARPRPVPPPEPALTNPPVNPEHPGKLVALGAAALSRMDPLPSTEEATRRWFDQHEGYSVPEPRSTT